MPSLSDNLLAAGCVAHAAAVHGERVVVLSGVDAGKSFVAIIEIESDIELTSELGADPRAKRIARFEIGKSPKLGLNDAIRMSDGKKYKAIRRPGIAYLTVDFELSELTAKDS